MSVVYSIEKHDMVQYDVEQYDEQYDIEQFDIGYDIEQFDLRMYDIDRRVPMNFADLDEIFPLSDAFIPVDWVEIEPPELIDLAAHGFTDGLPGSMTGHVFLNTEMTDVFSMVQPQMENPTRRLDATRCAHIPSITELEMLDEVPELESQDFGTKSRRCLTELL